MMERADQGVGRILRTLDRLNLSRDTIVIFTNDNGGESLARNAPLFNRKWALWEGGIRVPALVRWPGRIPAGKVPPQVGITMDLGASILPAAAAMVPAESRLEGMNLFPILEGRAQVVERTLFWRTNTGGHNQRAVRSGDWKLVVDGNHFLIFDVRKDVGERNDVANERQALARRLQSLLTTWEADVNAEAQSNGTVQINRGRGAGGAAARRVVAEGLQAAARFPNRRNPMNVQSRHLFLSACVTILMSMPASAESLAGSVRDTSGAVRPGVTVEAASPVLIEKIRTAVTDGNGLYQIANLPPGGYCITFSLAGFATVVREGVNLTGSGVTTINGELHASRGYGDYLAAIPAIQATGFNTGTQNSNNFFTARGGRSNEGAIQIERLEREGALDERGSSDAGPGPPEAACSRVARGGSERLGSRGGPKVLASAPASCRRCAPAFCCVHRRGAAPTVAGGGNARRATGPCGTQGRVSGRRDRVGRLGLGRVWRA